MPLVEWPPGVISFGPLPTSSRSIEERLPMPPLRLPEFPALEILSIEDVTYTSTHQDFTIAFSPALSPQQIQGALNALADYYRSCGGVGFKVDFELASVPVGVPKHVEQ